MTVYGALTFFQVLALLGLSLAATAGLALLSHYESHHADERFSKEHGNRQRLGR